MTVVTVHRYQYNLSLSEIIRYAWKSLKTRLQIVRKGEPRDERKQLLADIEFFRVHLDDLERRVRKFSSPAPKRAA